MKCTLIAIAFLISAVQLYAQVPEDILRYSWLAPNGTARNQALGGAMGSLGGDISATFVNPAGLGLYKTSEIILSPGFNFLNNKSDFRGTANAKSSSSFNFGTSGIVLGFNSRNNKWPSGAFSFAVNRTANFNSNIYYKGTNDFSSFSQQYADEFANSRLTVDQALNDPAISLGTKMALYTYLVDIDSSRNPPRIVGWPELLASRTQENSIETRGGITELAFGLAANNNDKFYIGGSIGIPIVNYQKNSTYTESDPTTDTSNRFQSSSLTEHYTTKGIGVNAKLGIIFKPVESVRVGLALHTPTLYGLKDTYRADMVTNTENYAKVQKVSSETFNNNQISAFEYNLVSPWKALLSVSYVFREVEDVARQRGFVTADVEYLTYKAANFQTADVNNSDNTYYDGINKTIDQIYKGTFNFRVGGELKFKTLMVRAGFAHYGNPNKDSQLKASREYMSGGLGYRNKGFIVDLAYVYGLQKDFNFPYLLSSVANTYATLKGNSGNVALTVGFKL